MGLYFSDFDIEYCSSEKENCTCDYVEISDGQLLIDKPLARICGTEKPPNVFSSGQFVRVDLVTDALNARKGFLAHFYSISPDGVTPSSADVDADKHLTSIPTSTDKPKKGNCAILILACNCFDVILCYVRHILYSPVSHVGAT